jgi:hypothetical protein
MRMLAVVEVVVLDRLAQPVEAAGAMVLEPF